MDIERNNKDILVKVLCVLSLVGSLKGSTTSAPLGCYTQPPGRGKSDHVNSCLDKYAVIPNQLYCQKNIIWQKMSDTDKTVIEDKFNEIRSAVSPPAANMLSLKYNDGLGRTAQVWAEMCHLTSSKPMQRFRPGSFAAGETIYVSDTQMSWTDVIDAWANEKSAFTFASLKNNQSLVSNYIQLVWASTSAVGCDVHTCGGKYFYVCHYTPAVDYDHPNTPYVSDKGSCGQCKTNCTNKLCDCKGIICLNGAKLNYDTCLCDCITEVNEYEPPTCELRCNANGDDKSCGTKYTKLSCSSSFETLFHCPWMCNICPYAGKNYTERSEPLPWERNRVECTTSTTFSTTKSNTTGASSSNKQGTGSTHPSTPINLQGGDNGGPNCSTSVFVVFVMVAVQIFFTANLQA